MDMSEWTPAATARFDQMLAEASAEIDRWALTLQVATGRHGEQQGLADVGAALGGLEKDELVGPLLVAVQRIERELAARDAGENRIQGIADGRDGPGLGDPGHEPEL